MTLLNMILAQVGAPVEGAVQQATDTIAAIADTAAAAVAPVAAAAPQAAEPIVKNLSVWDLTMAGGWLMIPLALLALVSVYIFFERLFAINSASRTDAMRI